MSREWKVLALGCCALALISHARAQSESESKP